MVVGSEVGKCGIQSIKATDINMVFFIGIITKRRVMKFTVPLLIFWSHRGW